MLVMDSKNTNYSGSSVINSVAIASFYGNSNSDGNLNISISALVDANFSTNIDTVKSDFDDFIDEVVSDM